jgi:hypothetical protein
MTGWTKREAVTNLVILGDGEGQQTKASGLLVAINPDRGYPDKMNYTIVRKDGEEITLSGSASLARQIGPADVGHFIKCEFTGWGKSPNGKFKAIDVFIFDGEPTDDMKKWPRFQEFQTAKTNGAKAPEKKVAPVGGGFEDFDEVTGGAQDTDDDMPF